MYLDNERRPTLTPRLAFRVAVIGGIALVAFGVIFFRLWYLQVLSADKYMAEAKNNQLREIKLQAPRGEIVDRNGTPLVENRLGFSLTLARDALPENAAERERLYRNLGRLLGRRPERVRRTVTNQFEDPDIPAFSPAVVKRDVSKEAVGHVLERSDLFPGVEPEPVFLRDYPQGEVGGHLFGSVGEVTAEDLENNSFPGLGYGDRVGRGGIEQQYDSVLRGKDGATRLSVDALGRLQKELEEKGPRAGRQVRLSIDLDVQRAGHDALSGGTGRGAFVAMDVKTGEVLGLGSEPSFDPSFFTRRFSQRAFQRLNSEELGKPLFDRATQGVYPVGSTFKLITAAAGLKSGLITPETVIMDGGSITIGDREFTNAGKVAHGPVALRQALTVSSDVFFYTLGNQLDSLGDGNGLQRWARRFGLGRPTGIDLPGEAAGLVPSRAWADELNRKYERCVKRRDPAPEELRQGVCSFLDGNLERPWSVGDNVNLSVGQGYIQTTPLQMAVAYAAIANGGRVVRPRLGQRIEDSAGRALQQLKAPEPRKLGLDTEFIQPILDGLRGAASEPGGTSTVVFQDFPVDVAGKTGTAEKGDGRADQSWYVALAPWPDFKYVVVTTDEAGGFGADTAAPMARRILAELFDVNETELVQGGEAAD
jgi:penicillin-binding protein 2